MKLLYPEFWQNKSTLAYFLLPLGWIYLALGALRRVITKPIRLPGYVICVGNCTVGGTGKTQVVIWLARKLKEKGVKFVILSKGFGGSYKDPVIVTSSMLAKYVGDEALELCQYGTTIVSRKVKDSLALLRSLAPEVIIIDDGMQNPGFIKDRIIMTVDGLRKFGNGFPIPAGPMRQTKRFKDIDAVVVVGGNDNIETNIKTSAPTFNASIMPTQSVDNSKKYYAFAGIGNPDRFFKTLKKAGLQCQTECVFPDHHVYLKQEIDKIYHEAQSQGLSIITTRKDYMKLGIYRDKISCLDVALHIEEESKLFDIAYEKPHEKS
ncbi:MAG: tetraacyldisaccharide 4'-kinase [Pseudomonadota bacterium]